MILQIFFLKLFIRALSKNEGNKKKKRVHLIIKQTCVPLIPSPQSIPTPYIYIYFFYYKYNNIKSVQSQVRIKEQLLTEEGLAQEALLQSIKLLVGEGVWGIA